MVTRAGLTEFYRAAEDFRRYNCEDPDARKRMARVLREERSRVGRSLLDIACGGGALAYCYEGPGRTYVGVDTNPDMIREARRAARARNSRSRFLFADARRMRLEGRFDTVTLLGNGLSHLTPGDLVQVLRRLEGHARAGARFIVDYRDSVQLFFDRKWARRYVQHKGGRRIESVTRGIDSERGEILITGRTQGDPRPTRYAQTIWAPFVLEPLMAAYGWDLLHRSRERRWVGWRDVYRLRGPGRARPRS